MNAAARALNKANIFDSKLGDVNFSPMLWCLCSLAIIVLLSAIALINTIDAHRGSLNSLASAQKKQFVLKNNWGKLTLEKTTLLTPSRVQYIAQNKLHMIKADNLKLV